MSIKDDLERDSKELGTGGNDFFKFESKTLSKIRILTLPRVIASHFFGKGSKPAICYGQDKGCPFHERNDDNDDDYGKLSVKYVAYVLDRKDNKVKVADLPYTIMKKLGTLEEDEDWKFEGFPMPYDMKVFFDKDKSPAEMYDVNQSPTKEPISKEIMEMLTAKMEKATPDDMIAKKKEYQISEHKKQGIWLSPEVIAKKKEDHAAQFREKVAQDNANVDAGKTEPIPTVKYPEEDEESDPEKIPF